MNRQGKKDGADARERSLWGSLVSLGMVFPIAIVLGWYMGQWVGGMLGHQRAGRLIGLALGVASGFWELFKVSRRLEGYDGHSGGGKNEGGGGDGG
jgi:positive regulator of sigma E activity